ncbi:RHS repeat-associated core domain-containing protein [Dyella sp. 2YAF14]|uniref:RHS repeat-associated core domain-containing protein n=1 Tax=Dyella sp. 2YAF14 TaxID=3233025 RepID=UPI003F9180E0
MFFRRTAFWLLVLFGLAFSLATAPTPVHAQVQNNGSTESQAYAGCVYDISYFNFYQYYGTYCRNVISRCQWVLYAPSGTILGGWFYNCGSPQDDFQTAVKSLGNSTGCHCSEGDSGGGKPSSGTPMAGDPINTFSGNAYLQEEDYSSDQWLTFRRFYNSYNVVASAAMGLQWRHSFDRSLDISGTPATDIVVLRPDGTQEFFTKTNGQWNTGFDSADTLAEIDDGQGNPIGYTVFLAALGHVEAYDANGLLQSAVDRTGNGINLTYSTSQTPTTVAPASGLLLTVTDPKGRQLKFTYDVGYHLHQVTLPDSGTLTYAYDRVGNLQSVQYPDNSIRTYVYNESNLTNGGTPTSAMTGLVDEASTRFLTTAFDSTGRAISTYLAGNVNATSVTYNADGSSTVQYALGGSTTINFAAANNAVQVGSVSQSCGTSCGQPWKTRTYDTNSNPASYVDFNGYTTATTYSNAALLTQQIDARGQPTQRTTNFTWDTAQRVPLTRTVLDNNGNTVAYGAWVYNNAGQASARCEADPTVAGGLGYACGSSANAPAGVRQSRYTYCTAVNTTQCPLVGLLLSVHGPRTDVSDITNYSYYLGTDESGCGTQGGACHHVGDLYQVTNALGQVTTYVAYDKSGRVVRQADANGVITDLTYSPRGWLLTRTVRANSNGTPSSGDAVTTIGYTPYGSVASITDADGVKVSYTYDAAHRLTDITDALGDRIHYTLDAAGNKTQEQTFDPSGTVRRTLSRTYNTLGQLTKVTDGLSHAVFNATYSDSYDANGNLVHTADALGVQRKQGYDGLNRLISTIDNYNGTDTATQNTQSVFAYDANDRLEGVGDPDGLNTTYSYDGLGNATGVQSPDTGGTTYVYDAAGNVTQRTDAKGVVSNSTYDALNRRTATTYADGTLNVAYGYDEPNSVTGCTASYPTGRLTRIVETAVTTVYCYDAHGNVTRKSQMQGTGTDITAYGYTLADRVASTLTPSGTSIQYSRDAAGRINGVTALPPGTSGAGAGNVVTAISYLPFGPIASYTLGNGQTITRTYDANYALTDVVSQALNLHFARDAMGNITALGNAPGANPAVESYSYDPLYRLTRLTDGNGNVEEAYTYSKTGDRLRKTASGLATGVYTYQAGTHHLASIGNASRAYDANGNTTGSVTGGSTFGYGYDGRNRMTVVQRDGSTVGTYTYNSLGQRTAKVATFPAAGSQRFSYDESSQLLGEYGSALRDYIWLGALPVAVVDTAGGVSVVSYVHADGLSTPRVVTDATGASIWQLAYQGNAFGEQQPTTSGGFAYNLRFPGQYYDVESGLVHNGYRDYEPAIGGYDQPDPSGLAAGPSLYAYVGSNPLSFVDSQGLQAENERDLLEPVDLAGPLQGANYRETLNRVRQYDPDFEDSVASRKEANYTRADVERLEEVLRGKAMEGCRAPSAQRPSKTPNTGAPGTTYTNPGSGQQRTYGPDGKPLFDVDYDHDHGQGVPHTHDWTDGVRGPGVPFNPNNGN